MKNEKIQYIKYILQIVYVKLIVFFVPVDIIFMILIGFLHKYIFPDETFNPLLTYYVGIAIKVIYLVTILILGIIIIICSFRAYHNKQIVVCIRSMQILKYGVPIVYIIYLVIFLLYQIAMTEPIMALILFFLTFLFNEGIGIEITTIIFMKPIYLLLLFWILIIPGAFYGVQVIRLSYFKHRLGKFMSVVHCILQFIFLVDIIDTIYLSKKLPYIYNKDQKKP